MSTPNLENVALFAVVYIFFAGVFWQAARGDSENWGDVIAALLFPVSVIFILGAVVAGIFQGAFRGK